MTRKKPSPTASLVCSSAAEYLSFVAVGRGGVEAVYADENLWRIRVIMNLIYDVEVPTINYHPEKVFEDSELGENQSFEIFESLSLMRKATTRRTTSFQRLSLSATSLAESAVHRRPVTLGPRV